MFKCGRCSKEFDTRDELLDHRKYPCEIPELVSLAPTQKADDPLRCKVCGKKFDSVFGLGGHMKVHYGRPRKPRAAKAKPVQVADDVPDAKMVCVECGTMWEIYGPIDMEICPNCSSDLFAVGETRTIKVVVQ